MDLSNDDSSHGPLLRGATAYLQRGLGIGPETQETTDSYDQTAAQFAARWGDLRLEQALNAFTTRVTGQRRVLDLGCGPGRDLGLLAQLGCRPCGLDLSPGMLSLAGHRLPGVPLVLADVRRPPFATGGFDGVWACASLLHLPRSQLPAVLVEAVRLLRRPGGVLFLALKSGQGERWVTGSGGRRFFFAYHLPAEIETLLGKAGFQVVESWSEPNPSSPHEPWLDWVATI